jgi:hypothetical protein
VEQAVEDLALMGAQGFHPSYIAARVDAPTEEVLPVLAGIAERGDLNETFELVCPTCGRTVATYKLGDRLPLEDLVECTKTVDDPPFVVQQRDFIITYSPTSGYLSRILRNHSLKGIKKKKPARGWRRIASYLKPSVPSSS